MTAVIGPTLSRARTRLVLAVVAAAAQQLVELLIPVVLGWVTGRAIEDGDLAAIWSGGAALVSIAVARAGLDAWRHSLENTASAVAAGQLRRSVLRGLLGRGRGGLDPGDVVARGTDDTDVVVDLVDTLGWTAGYALSIPVALVALAWIDPYLAAAALLAALAGGIGVQLASRIYDRRSDVFQQAIARSVGEAQAVLGAHTSARGLAAFGALHRRFVEASREVSASARSLANLELLIGPIRALAAAAPVALVLTWGGHRVGGGELEIGALVTAIGLAWYVAMPLDAVLAQVLQFGSVRASARRISAVAGTQPPATEPHERVSLAHEPAFWTMSLRANLTLGRQRSDAQLHAALRDVELGDVDWPDGLDTQLADAGRTLSGGQRQRLALARALLHASVIEPGDGLDGVGPAQRERLLAALREHNDG